MEGFNCCVINRARRKIAAGCLLAAVMLFSASVTFAFAKEDGQYEAGGQYLEDGEYSVAVDLMGGSGKAAVVSPTILTVENGNAAARIQWSSSNYDYMIVDGVKYQNESEENMNSVFEIPVICWDEEMEVIADTTAMGHPVEIHYQMVFYSDSVGSKAQLPQEAAKRVLCVAFAIMVIGGILNHFVKKYIYS